MGQLAAHVPEAATGFRIETPGATVIDLGTDFAVQAVKEKESEVHVFNGEVLVDLHGEKGSTADLLRLISGEAARVDYITGMPSGIDLDEQRFLRSLRDETPSYARVILAMKPVVYYRMEPSGDGNQLLDASPSGANATIHLGRATAPVWAAGRVGAALTLGGPAEQTYASAYRYPQANENVITVAAWVYAKSRPRWASIAKNWAGGDDDRGQFHFGLYEDSGELEAHIVDSSGKEIVILDKVPLPLYQWHHVAFVADGSTLRLYRNGREVDSKPYRELHKDPRITALAIGTKLNLLGSAPEDAADDAATMSPFGSNIYGVCSSNVAVLSPGFTSIVNWEVVGLVYLSGTSSFPTAARDATRSSAASLSCPLDYRIVGTVFNGFDRQRKLPRAMNSFQIIEKSRNKS
jgi:hypothetical protein